MKFLALLSILAVLTVPVEAKGKGGNKGRNEAAKKEEARKKKEREEREHRRDKIEDFMKTRDANHDGSLTKEEYLSGETDKAQGEKSFDQFNKNGDRYLSKGEIQEMLGL